MHRALLASLAAAALLVPAGAAQGVPRVERPFARPAATTAAAPTAQVHGSRFGRVLFDRRGFVLYVFTRDPRGRSVCRGQCAKAWPPLIVRRRPTAGRGLRRSLLGTTRRRDGRRQVTYAGRPLYFYVGDTRPGQISCQNVVEFGGTWLVQSPDGAPVR
jgi:predicted lipoprotein with Yx(FWY)xxD motif